MKKILGLDLGTNSIGWALIEQLFSDRNGRILGMGSRIIPMDQGSLGDFEKGNSVSQTADRTNFRGIRRLRERFLLRRERLNRVLYKLGFLPEHYARQIDFDQHFGKFLEKTEPKIAYQVNSETDKYEFIFKTSFEEMIEDFKKCQPQLFENNKKIPYDWTIYYLRKKALTYPIAKAELAWLLFHFNQKRGYYQLRGEEEEENKNKLVEFYELKVVDVLDSGDKKNKDEIWYNVILENGWIYRRTSRIPLDWVGKTKEFIVTTDINDDGSIKTDKEGKEKRSFRSPGADDWTLVKKRTEAEIEKSKHTVGTYIYDALLQSPGQKIKGKLVRTIERKFYREELKLILEMQQTFHPELQDKKKYAVCLEELYRNNLDHRIAYGQKDFAHLFINDIIFYQRPLKSKKSEISECRYESRKYIDKEGIMKTESLKCIAKSHPLFQEFRLWQFLQNLTIYQREKYIDGRLYTDVNVTNDFLKSEEDWVALFDFLNDRKEIDQKALLKYPGFNLKKNAEQYRWNYVEDKTYPANETRSQMLNKLKAANIANEFLSKDNEELLWQILSSVDDKTEIEKALTTFAVKHSLPKELIENFRKLTPFKKEYGAYSAKAIKKLIPLMRRGKYWSEESISNETKSRITTIVERLDSIEYDKLKIDTVTDDDIPKQVLKSFINCRNPLTSLNTYQACYAVYGRHSEEGEVVKWELPDDIEHFLKHTFKQHSLRNPIVEQIITETLRVVSDIWKQYGNGQKDFFDEIHIELGREMKNTAEQRKRITSSVTENENTNLRIKALLAELKNDNSVQNVRPYSPSQQEILKLYEEGVLGAVTDIPEEILKISKNAQPTSSELTRYKLWLDQQYRSPYTGEVIPLGKLFTPSYQIEHIIPQSRYFDDSLSNKVICESEVNKDKDNKTAYAYIKEFHGKIIELDFGKKVMLLTLDAYEDFVKNRFAKNRAKMKKLLMEDIPDEFINRQMNDTRYISILIKNLLSNIVREEGEVETTSKNITACNGSITSTLKQDWGLNDVWNELITPRFERMNDLTKSNNFGQWTNKDGKKVFQTDMPLELQKGFTKKRIDHRHHAMDALVIACATRSHINYLNNESAKSTSKDLRYDLKQKLCFKTKPDENGNYKWQFTKPWNTFTQDAKQKLSTTIVSFKQNLRVINKTSNWYQRWEKQNDGSLKKIFVKQESGDHWAIRKPMHKDTVSGLVKLRFKKTVQLAAALDQWEMIVEKSLKNQIKTLIIQGFDKIKLRKFFRELDDKWSGKEIGKVEIYYFENEMVASRSALNEAYNTNFIKSITDTASQKILLNHLEKYNATKDGKIIEHPELAFSPDGLDEMNKNIVQLNDGKFHQPIYKVRSFEPKGNKFNVGTTGNKTQKFVEAAKGTNLFFAIYQNNEGKRSYESIPLNIVIERQKQGLKPVPENNEKGDLLLFYLSPNDLVYIPNEDEKNNQIIDTHKMENSIHKFVSCTDTEGHFVPHYYSSPLLKNEIGSNNKSQNSINGIQIKAVCWKLQINRIGQIISVNGKLINTESVKVEEFPSGVNL
ncbi:MAG: type II CRISPR RNA-guided endonuclease Cas9 [Mariniphaga sp.]